MELNTHNEVQIEVRNVVGLQAVFQQEYNAEYDIPIFENRKSQIYVDCPEDVMREKLELPKSSYAKAWRIYQNLNQNQTKSDKAFSSQKEMENRVLESAQFLKLLKSKQDHKLHNTQSRIDFAKPSQAFIKRKRNILESDVLTSEEVTVSPILEKYYNVANGLHYDARRWTEDEDSAKHMSISDVENLKRLVAYDTKYVPELETMLVQRLVPTSEIFYELLVRGLVNDIQVQIGDLIFHCASNVLQAYSRWFVTNLNKQTNVILPMDKVPAHIFAKLYAWMLCENAKMIHTDMLNMFVAAKYLGIKDYMSQCWICLTEESISEQNAFMFYLLARQYQFIQLMDVMLARVRKIFIYLVASEDFLELDKHEIIYILKQNTICVNSEEEVFYAVVRWVAADWPARKKYTLEVIKTVRFRLMNTQFISNQLESSENIAIIKEICAEPEIFKMLSDHLVYQMTQKYTAFNKYKEESYIKKYMINPPEERCWIFNRNVPHHHAKMCSTYKQINYETFTDYLTELQTLDSNEFFKTTVQIKNKYLNNFSCGCLENLEEIHQLQEIN